MPASKPGTTLSLVSDERSGGILDRSVYWHLSAFYFAYCAVLGVVFPYWSLYLEFRDYSSYQIGVVGAMLLGSNVVAANVWGWLADRSGARVRLIQVGYALAFFSFACVPWAEHFAALLFFTFLGSFCWQGLLPQLEVIAVDLSHADKGSYARARMWGSVGFIVASMVVGEWISYSSYAVVPTAVIAVLFCICLISLNFSKVAVHHQDLVKGHCDIKMEKWPILIFLLMGFLLHVSHGSYYTFYSLYLAHNDFAGVDISVLWSLAVAAEILMFFFLKQVLARCHHGHLLVVSLAMTVLRWFLIAMFPSSVWIVLFAQLLHAFSFAGFHVCALECIRILFGKNFHGRGQALYASVCVALGAASGSYISGVLWGHNPLWVFLSAAAFAFTALVLALVFVGKHGHRFKI